MQVDKEFEGCMLGLKQSSHVIAKGVQKAVLNWIMWASLGNPVLTVITTYRIGWSPPESLCLEGWGRER